MTKFESSLRRKLTLMHAYLCSIRDTDREWLIDSLNPQEVYSVFYAKSPLHYYLISHEERRGGGACTQRREVVANLRNEAIARVVPSVRRAYARSFTVSTRDACQGGENKERRESRNLSCSSRTTCSSGVVVLVGSPRAELTAPEI